MALRRCLHVCTTGERWGPGRFSVSASNGRRVRWCVRLDGGNQRQSVAQILGCWGTIWRVYEGACSDWSLCCCSCAGDGEFAPELRAAASRLGCAAAVEPAESGVAEVVQGEQGADNLPGRQTTLWRCVRWREYL